MKGQGQSLTLAQGQSDFFFWEKNDQLVKFHISYVSYMEERNENSFSLVWSHDQASRHTIYGKIASQIFFSRTNGSISLNVGI